MSYTDAELEANERRLPGRRRTDGLPFDLRPAAGVSLEALDTVFLRERYLPTVIPQDEWDGDARSLEQQLHSQRLAREGEPTWGALIAFASDPLAFVPGAALEFLRLQGNEVTAPILSKHTLAGRLDAVVRQLDELIRLHVATRVRVAGTLTEQRSPDYPVDALRQLAHNAIMHRSYEGTHTPVRIYWYGDRVEIVSPGGLYGRMNQENFLQGDTDYRNPLLAEVMANLGIGRRFGLGLPLARKALCANGNPPPAFCLRQTLIAATVRARPEQ